MMQSLLSPILTPTLEGSLSRPLSPVMGNGMFGWHDMADLSVITEAAGAVSQVDDKSGQNNHVVQALGADQPLTGVLKQNGLNILQWNGDNDNLMSAGLTGGDINNPITVFCVAQHEAPLPTGTRRYYTMSSIGNNGRCSLQKRSNGNGNTYRIRDNTNLTSVPPLVADTQMKITMAIFDGANSSLVVNRQLMMAGNTGTNDPAADGILLGAGSGSDGNNFEGGYAEFIAYAGVLPYALRELTLQYLEGKWGVA